MAALSQGVKVTADDLTELVKSLGLDDADANDLVGGLGLSAKATSLTPKQDRSAPEQKAPVSPPKLSILQVGGGSTRKGSRGEERDSETENADDLDASGSESDVSDVAELPAVPRLKPGISARKRTDEPPLVSPLTPSPGDKSFASTSDTVQPPKPRSFITPEPTTTPK